MLIEDIHRNNPNNCYIFNQLKVVNSIIDFCKERHNNYISYNYNDQIMELINHLNPNPSDLKYNNEILDPLHYIEGEKKIIKFITSEYRLYKIKMPLNITKMDLYSIAETYRERFYSKILLVYKDAILEKDETSIDFISDDDTFIIIEDRIYPNDTYYKSIIAQNKNEEMLSFDIKIDNDWDNSFRLSFPSNIPFSEMRKAIELKIGDHNILFIGVSDRKNDTIIKKLFRNPNKIIKIHISDGAPLSIMEYYGKQILADVIVDKNEKKNFKTPIGLLNSNKYLINIIEMRTYLKVKKIYFNEKEISMDKEKSLSSLGIKDNFICRVEI